MAEQLTTLDLVEQLSADCNSGEGLQGPIPCDPGPSVYELPPDPFPQWELFLDFDEMQAPVYPSWT